MEKLGNQPAFPVSTNLIAMTGDETLNPHGMSTRLYIATGAMQSLITTTSYPLGRHTLKGIARLSIALADAVLEEYSQPSE